MTRPPVRVLVIGAGYAGMLFTMRLAGRFARRAVQVTLVNDAETFTERPRLHQFATNMTYPWRSIPQMLRKTSVQFVRGRVTSIDAARRAVVLEGRDQHGLEYDYLVYALGSATDRTRVPGVDQHAYTLAPRGPLSAEALRDALPPLAVSGGRVIVAGGGATGIETAAEIASVYPGIAVSLVTRGPLAFSANDRTPACPCAWPR